MVEQLEPSGATHAFGLSARMGKRVNEVCVFTRACASRADGWVWGARVANRHFSKQLVQTSVIVPSEIVQLPSLQVTVALDASPPFVT